jgi:hypothetical protein
MITYLYWALIIGLVITLVVVIGVRMDNLKVALVAAAVVLFAGWVAYYFYFQQIFVKRWGGIMTVTVPDGQYHVATTWKDDNLWIENYDPETNNCVFSEYSKGNLLQGRVTIKNCNPLGLPFGTAAQRSPGVAASPGKKQPAPAGDGVSSESGSGRR